LITTLLMVAMTAGLFLDGWSHMGAGVAALRRDENR
jgi:hypothetical protein